ncbi:hypothetical protein Bbelb_290410 [Branchiostoma belcheri]|nr:hypothetical protein Bbelb_290410 [Branchiostoma belcheri]
MSRRRRGRSRPYCIVLTGSSTEVEQERDLTITGTTSLDRAFSQSPSAEHGSMPANLHGRYGGVKNSEWSLPLGQQLPDGLAWMKGTLELWVAVGVVLYTCTPRTYVTLGQHAVGSKVLRDRIKLHLSAFRTRSKRAAVILTDGNTEDPAGMAAVRVRCSYLCQVFLPVPGVLTCARCSYLYQEAAAALDARINLYGVGVGTLVNQAGLEDITGDPQRIFSVSSDPCIAAQKIMDDLNGGQPHQNLRQQL